MKKLKLNLLWITAAVVALSSCGGVQKMVENAETVKYDVQPNPLETHGGEVEVTINTTFPEKYFNKKVVVTATPVLKYEGGQTEFEPTVLQGESVEANNKVIPYLGGSYSFTGKIPYKPEMLKSQLVIEMSAELKGNTIDIPGVPVATGVLATSTLVKVNPQPIMMGDNFERIIPEEYESEILYLINKYNVRRSALKSEEMVAFNEELAAAVANERVQLTSAQISSYASPDGEIDLNTKLSGKRGETAEAYLAKALKKLNVEGANSAEFLKVASTAEDWDGFKELMEKSSIQDKELILRVLSMHSDPEVREQEIKNIAAAFNEIKTEVLPLLRRSQMKISADVIGYSDAELDSIVKTNPDTLTVEEILYAASLTKDDEAKLAIYSKAAEMYPEDVRTVNNVGYVCIKLGKLAEAKAALDKAKAIKEDDIVKNNLGVVALLEGDAATAEELFTAAMGAGDAVNSNLGIIKIQQGEYAAAVNYFGNKPSYNAALAQLLNGDAAKCSATLNELGETECGLDYYLKAVSGARAGREEVVINNLRKAIEKKADLKQRAINDVEFRNYVASEGFAAIVQ